MRNLGNIHHMFHLEYGKIYMVHLGDSFIENLHVFIPTGNFYYKHLTRTVTKKLWLTSEATDSTLQMDLHKWFVTWNYLSHDMSLWELDSEEELEKFLFMEELTK